MTARHTTRQRPMVLLVALALAAGACGGGDGDETSGADKQSKTGTGANVITGPETGAALETVEKDRLTVCTDVPSVPFAFEQEGSLDGIDIELVRALSGRLALQPNFKDVEPKAIFGALDARECDMVAAGVTVSERLGKTVDFSEVYFRVNQSLLVRKGDETRYNDLASLKGRTIGVQPGTSGAALAKERGDGATIEELPSAHDLHTALKAGEVDAVIHDFPVNVHSARTTGDTVVAQTFSEGHQKEYVFAMRKGSDDLKRAIDGALTQVKSDDTYPTILRRFLGDTAGQI